MSKRIIGFAGIEVIDKILYLSRICVNFGDNVLILDYSNADEIECCIPFHSDINIQKDMIDYRGVDFSKIALTKDLKDKYDTILINFGYTKNRKEVQECTHFICTTDLQKPHIQNLLTIDLPNELSFKQLVVRGKVTRGLSVKENLREVMDYLGTQNYYYQRYKEVDEKARYLCQYNDLFIFKEISNDFKDYLYELTSVLYPECNGRILRENIKKAERGM